MKKWCLGALISGVVAVVTGGCSGDKNANEPTCKTGSETCECYPNKTCDDGLACFANLCLDLDGVGGVGGVVQGSGGDAETSAGGAPDDTSQGAKSMGGGGTGSGTAGTSSLGGSISTGGKGGGRTGSSRQEREPSDARALAADGP